MDVKYYKSNEEHIYVSKCGKVMSDNIHRLAKKFPTIYLDKDGYNRVWVKRNGMKKFITVHRLVLSTFNKPPSKEYVVNHKNGIRTDNRLENLEWLTAADNERHARKVLFKRCVGEKASRSKLKEIDVENIIKRNRMGDGSKKLSIDFNISISQIVRILKGKNWSHVWQKLSK